MKRVYCGGFFQTDAAEKQEMVSWSFSISVSERLMVPDLQLLGLNEVANQTGPNRQRVELHSKSANCHMELFAFYILVSTQSADISEVYGAFYVRLPNAPWKHRIRCCLYFRM